MPILLILSAVFLTSCAKKEAPAPNTGHDAKLADVSYGPHARNRMDVYLPAGRTKQTPFVILVHGGAWMTGRKEDVQRFQELLLQHGIGSAAINYRYVNTGTHYAELMQDIRNAINRCAYFSDAWVLRNTKFMLAGVSAGAHMALLYSYKYDTDNQIAGVISLAGPTDLTDPAMLEHALAIDLKDAIFNLVGAKYAPEQPLPAQFADASPIKHVKSQPTLMIHGTKDEVVLYSQSERLTVRLQQQNITHKLVSLTDEGHDLGLSKPAVLKLVEDETVNWVKQYGK